MRAATTVPPRTPVVVAARRTPIVTAGRGLAHLPVHDLAAPVLRAVIDDLGPAAPPVNDVVLGCATSPGGNIARLSALSAGLGEQVPGVTVDRQCGSGLEALRVAAALVASGQADLVLAGGAESASTSGGRRAPFAPAGFPDPEMGAAADALADARGIGRARQDAYAARSHRLAVAAMDAGEFAAETVPVAGTSIDDRPRRRLDATRLARFPAAFTKGGTVTAGNSCGISDGAAALAVVPEEVRAALGVPGLAVRSTAVAGVTPALPGLGAAPAIRTALDRADRTLDDVGRIEVTEAFAAQLLACTDELALDPLGDDADRVSPHGGAIALGHPWGASGALLVVRLFSSTARRLEPQTGIGLAACAVGGGLGVAAVLERVE